MAPSVAILISGEADVDVRATAASSLRALGAIGTPGTVTVCHADDDALAAMDPDVQRFKGSLSEAIARTTSDLVVTVSTIEPDPFGRIVALVEERDRADIVVASFASLDRGTRPKDFASEFDRLGSRITARLLTLEVLDLLSTTRLYKRAVIDDLVDHGCDFEDSIGVLISATVRGWKIREIERPYWPTRRPSHQVSRPNVRSLAHYWAERNGIHSADYDMRAFNSRIPVQRRWQQRRHELTVDLVAPRFGGRILNVGCGSARMNLELPDAYGVDVVQPKLRYLSRYGVNHLAAASVFQLPFADAQFDCVVCAEVIEHVPIEGRPVRELVRVLRDDGRLVISTPDYGTSVWPVIERLYGFFQPSGYADEHVTHYTEQSLREELASYGMGCVEMKRLYGAILIGAFERETDKKST